MPDAAKRTRGFTLVEIALGILAVGLILGAAIKGKQLLENARFTALQRHENMLDAAINTILSNGTSARDISFETDIKKTPCNATPQRCIFSPDGGQATNRPPPFGIGSWVSDSRILGGPEGKTPGAWGYKDTTDPVLGYYIDGVGSNSNVSGRDAFAYLGGVSLSACQQINRKLGIPPSSPRSDPNGIWYSSAVFFDTNNGKGQSTFTRGNVINAIIGAPSACIGLWAYVYYHTLIPN